MHLNIAHTTKHTKRYGQMWTQTYDAMHIPGVAETKSLTCLALVVTYFKRKIMVFNSLLKLRAAKSREGENAV